MVAAISDPRSNLSAERTRETNTYPSNIMFSLQHDTGKWCTEYTWSVEDGMWGIRGLHNFGKLGNPSETADEIDKSVSTVQGARSEMKRIDEEDAMEGGLKGRLSAGAEFYFSAKERSAGGGCISFLLLQLYSYMAASIHRRTFHDDARCNPSIISAPGSTVDVAYLECLTGTSIPAAHNHHRTVQSDVRSYHWRICGSRLP